MAITSMRRIDVLVDAPLLRRIRTAATDAGVTTYFVMRVQSGDDARGRWSDDQVTGGAGSRVMFSAIVETSREAAVIAMLEPLIDDYSLTVLVSDVERVTTGK